jgi:hypothetical protein
MAFLESNDKNDSLLPFEIVTSKITGDRNIHQWRALQSVHLSFVRTEEHCQTLRCHGNKQNQNTRHYFFPPLSRNLLVQLKYYLQPGKVSQYSE